MPELPNDILEECFARVPLSSHPVLAQVSRSFRSLIGSQRIFELRTQLRTTEHFVCINFRTPTDQSRWYLLIRRNHNRPACFRPLPCTPHPTFGSACTALGHSLYVLGGRFPRYPSNAVQIYDARLNTWRTGPRMLACRHFASAGAIGGRIYIVGGDARSSASWAEAFDPASDKWYPILRTSDLPGKTVIQSSSLNARFLATDNGGLVYAPNKVMVLPWGPALKNYMERTVVLDGLVYMYDWRGNFWGRNPDTKDFKHVQGIEGELHVDSLQRSRITNLGGLLCVLWMESDVVYCVGIQITRMSCGRLLGSIAWRESLPLPTDLTSPAQLGHCVTLEF